MDNLSEKDVFARNWYESVLGKKPKEVIDNIIKNNPGNVRDFSKSIEKYPNEQRKILWKPERLENDQKGRKVFALGVIDRGHSYGQESFKLGLEMSDYIEEGDKRTYRIPYPSQSSPIVMIMSEDQVKEVAKVLDLDAFTAPKS